MPTPPPPPTSTLPMTLLKPPVSKHSLTSTVDPPNQHVLKQARARATTHHHRSRTPPALSQRTHAATEHTPSLKTYTVITNHMHRPGTHAITGHTHPHNTPTHTKTQNTLSCSTRTVPEHALHRHQGVRRLAVACVLHHQHSELAAGNELLHQRAPVLAHKLAHLQGGASGR